MLLTQRTLAPAGRLCKRYGLAAHCTHTASLLRRATARTQRTQIRAFAAHLRPPYFELWSGKNVKNAYVVYTGEGRAG